MVIFHANATKPIAPASFEALSAAARCQTVNTSSGPVEYQADYGKALAVEAAHGVIGAPNRVKTPSANGSYYSSFDIVDINAWIAGGGSNGSARSAIADEGTPDLGLLLAVAPGLASVASYYSHDSLAVYTPILNRVKPFFNNANGGDRDLMVQLPAGFSAQDTVFANGSLLLVAGVQTNATSGLCFPYLLSYTIAPAAGGAGSYTLASSTLLSKVAAGRTVNGDPLGLLSMPCAERPSNRLSVDAYNGSVAVGVAGIQCAFVLPLSALNGSATTAVCAPFKQSGLEIWNRFGSSVGFLQDGSIAVLSRVYVSVLDPSLINGSSVYLNDTLALRLPNSLMSSAYQRAFLDLAVAAKLIVAVMTSDSTQPQTALFPIGELPPGQLWSYNTESIKLCPTGRFRDAPSVQPCKYCPAGFYQNATGATECAECPDDTYCPRGAVYPYDMVSVCSLRGTLHALQRTARRAPLVFRCRAAARSWPELNGGWGAA